MSFLSDLFHGNFSNLGSDLNPSNIFSDTGTDIVKGLKNPAVDVGLAGLAAIALPELLPAIGADLGIGGAAAGAADVGLSAADTAAASSGALGFAGDVGTDTSLTSFLTDPAAAAASGGATAGSALPSGALALTAPDAASTVAPSVASIAQDAASGAGAAGSAAGGASGGGILSGIQSTLAPIGATLKTLAPIAGAGGLGYSLYQGYEAKKAQNALTAQEQAQASQEQAIATTDLNAAQPALATGQQLQSYLSTGTLPQAFQDQVSQQVAAAKASIIQGYAARGMPTDPKMNSALQQDLNNVDVQAQTLTANLEQTLATQGNAMVTQANQLLQSGASATEISAQIPIIMAQLNQQLNQSTATALSNFAAAMNAGGAVNQKPGTVTLQLAS